MRNMEKIILSFLVVVFSGIFLNAQESTDENIAEKDVVELSKVVVSGKAVKTPKNTEIGRDKIQNNLSKDIKEIFRSESSVEVGGGSRAAQRLYVRGVEATNFNFSIDGASRGMNLFQHRGNIGGINPDLLKQVDVQTLPSADQGPGALGGSIKFETVDAQDLLDSGKTIGAIVRGGYSSVDNGNVLGGSAFIKPWEHVGFFFNYTRNDFDKYKDGNGDDTFGSEGKDISFFGKMSILDWNGHSLRLSAESYEDDGTYTGDWTTNTTMAQSATHHVVKRQSYVLDHRLKPSSSRLIDSRINLYINKEEFDWTSFSTGEVSKMKSDGMGGDLRNTFHFDVAFVKSDLTVGVDASSDAGEESGYDVDVEMKNLGLYLQNRMLITRFLQLSFGARYDRFDSDFGTLGYDGNSFSPNIGGEVNLPLGFSVYGSYGEATRAKGTVPLCFLVNMADDCGINSISGKDSYGKSLKPEESKTYQFGITNKNQGLFTADDHIHAEVSYFNSKFENLIMQEGGWRGLEVTSIYNDDPINSEGYEIKLGWGLAGFNTNFAFTHADTTYDDGTAVGFVRRRAVSTGDTFVWDTFWSLNENVGFGYTFKNVSAFHKDDYDHDGYMLHNAKIIFTPAFYHLNGFKLSLAVFNILDETYASHASNGSDEDDDIILEPGRDIRVDASYKFQF